jgi:hypothetical protein
MTVEGHEEELGPIDVVVIGYPAGAPMTGEAIPILLDLVDRGIVRVLDALFVRTDADGTFSGFDIADLDQDSIGDLTAFAGATTGLLDDDDVALAAAEIEPGTTASAVASTTAGLSRTRRSITRSRPSSTTKSLRPRLLRRPRPAPDLTR